ncbi:vanadium binding protein 4 [Ciona intestinalis]
MKTFCVVTIVLVFALVYVDALGNHHRGGLMGSEMPKCLKTCKVDCTPMRPCALARCPSRCQATREAAEGSGPNRCMIKCGLTECLPRFPNCLSCVARCAEPVTKCKLNSCAVECPAGMSIPEHMGLRGCARCVRRNCRNLITGN